MKQFNDVPKSDSSDSSRGSPRCPDRPPAAIAGRTSLKSQLELRMNIRRISNLKLQRGAVPAILHGAAGLLSALESTCGRIELLVKLASGRNLCSACVSPLRTYPTLSFGLMRIRKAPFLFFGSMRWLCASKRLIFPKYQLGHMRETNSTAMCCNRPKTVTHSLFRVTDNYLHVACVSHVSQRDTKANK